VLDIENFWNGPFFVKKKINEDYKKKNFFYFVEHKLNCFVYKGFYINKVNKKIYQLISDHGNGNILSPCKYGSEIGDITTNLKYVTCLQNIYNLNGVNKTFLFLANIGAFVHSIHNKYNKLKYALSSGTYAVVEKQIEDINITELKLPSGQYKYIQSDLNVYIGRNGNIFKNHIVWGSWGFKHKNLNHYPVVRGVAMNPVDHPNGGRSKIKKPFKNKYNKIAKNHK